MTYRFQKQRKDDLYLRYGVSVVFVVFVYCVPSNYKSDKLILFFFTGVSRAKSKSSRDTFFLG